MTLSILLLYLLLGSCAGLLAGLFGVGGGLIVISVLLFSFKLLGFPADTTTHLAVGTSLASIIFTSFSSTQAHYKKGNVDWQLVKWLGLGIVVGCFVGSFIASSLQGSTLRIIIGCFAVMMAVQLAFDIKPKASKLLPSKIGLGIAGWFIGGVSAVFGIGGGSLTVPFLVWYSVPMQRAVAISAACGIPIAVVGTLSYLYFGWSVKDLPNGSFGYIYLPALLGICATSMISSKFGAKLAYQLSAQLLQKLFAAFLFFVGCSFFIPS